MSLRGTPQTAWITGDPPSDRRSTFGAEDPRSICKSPTRSVLEVQGPSRRFNAV
jgi:hypothetical protein